MLEQRRLPCEIENTLSTNGHFHPVMNTFRLVWNDGVFSPSFVISTMFHFTLHTAGL